MGWLQCFAQEHRNGHVPDLLAADAPVGARGDHIGDALLAPGRVPDDLVDFLDSELAKCFFRAVGPAHRGFHTDEPLLGGAEDDWIVATPAMGIGVLELRAAQQRAAFFEHGDDDRIRLPDSQAVVGRRLRRCQESGSKWMCPPASTREVGSRP